MNDGGKLLLKIISVIFIIFGVIATVVSVIALITATGLGAGWVVASIILLASSVIELIIGFVGLKKSDDPSQANFFIVTGFVLGILMLISMIMSFSAWNLIGFALPVLYGMTREQAAPGRRERIRQVLELIAEVKGYTGQISEINAADTDNLTITYSVEQAGNPLGNSVRLMLGNQRYLSRLKNFLTNYPEISRRLPNARLFDLRLDDRITAVEGASDAR
jgi:hypothetical protein